MKRIVLTFGLISGAILGAMTSIILPLCMSGILDFDQSEIIGYTSMVLSFAMVFFGIRTYREREGGGRITFGRAFKVGILITLVTCAVYVVAWEIVYWGFIPDFDARYAEFVISEARESGVPAAEIAETEREMAEFRELYKNPLFNIGITFLEVFPVGLIVTLVCAAILRRREPRSPVAELGRAAS